MSLSDLDVKAIYNANGVTVAFAIPFSPISSDSDETFVYTFDPTADPIVETLKTEGALQDYTLTGASPPGTPFDTHVTFNSAPANGLKVMVIRKLALTQPTDLDASQNVNLTTIETMLDRATALIQQLDEAIQRAPKFRKSYTTVTDPLLPVPSSGQYLRWNSDEDGLENATPVLSSNGGTLGTPASSTDNAIVRWDGTGGDTVQDSDVTISDADVISAVGVLLSGLTASRAVTTDGSKNLATIATTATELGYVNGVTSAIQTQLNTKAPTASPTFSGTITTPLTASRALVTGASSELAVSAVTATELGHLSGVSSAVQTQLNAITTITTDHETRITTLEGAPAGGGGGGSLSWIERADAPLYDTTNDVECYIFEDAVTQYLYTTIHVPSSYVAGSQINLKIPFYSSGTSNTVLMQTQATLIRTATDAISSTTNQRTSTNSAVTLAAGTVDEPQMVTFDLTDGSGQINSVAVAANDIIKVRLTRDTATDTSTAGAYVMVYAAAPTFS